MIEEINKIKDQLGAVSESVARQEVQVASLLESARNVARMAETQAEQNAITERRLSLIEREVLLLDKLSMSMETLNREINGLKLARAKSAGVILGLGAAGGGIVQMIKSAIGG